MRSTNDYREILSDPEVADRLLIKNESDTEIKLPQIDYYHLKDSSPEAENKWAHAIQELTGSKDFFAERPDAITVYGRKLHVPWQHDGAAYFDFEDICETPLAAADYISIASRYHTIIIDNVPALTMMQKNEARRLITLLDALYECRCRLLIRAEAPPEDMFFADVRDRIEEEQSQSLDQEMFSEVAQDLSAPFRPNVSSYENNDRETTPEREQKKLFQPHNNNDESMMSNSDAAQEDPSNKFFPATKSSQDFTKVSAFTGEDERFAYKRAVSRLKEMTGSKRWFQDGQWMPVDDSARPWETIDTKTSSTVRKIVDSVSSPFRSKSEQAPVIDASHFWSMVEWGPGKRLKDEHASKWIKGNTIYKIKG